MQRASKLPLPHECTDLIIAHLADDRRTLHALILSSKILFQRTVPILYRNPFKLIEHSRALTKWSKDDIDQRYAQLIAIFLTSRSSPTPTEITDAAEAAAAATAGARTTTRTGQHESGSDTSTGALSSELSSSATTIAASSPLQLALPLDPTIATADGMIDYLRYYKCQYSVDLWEALDCLLSLRLPQSYTFHRMGRHELWKTITLAMLTYNLHEIRVISLPLSLSRSVLLPLVDKFRSLIRLEIYDIPSTFDISAVFEFIQLHDSIHKSKLREIKIMGKDDSDVSLVLGHRRLVELVRVMKRPEVVDARHWHEGVNVLDRIPVQHLRSLLLCMAIVPPASMPVCDFLASCEHLETLRMRIRDDRLFRWAVARRRELEQWIIERKRLQLVVQTNGSLHINSSANGSSSSSSSGSSSSGGSSSEGDNYSIGSRSEDDARELNGDNSQGQGSGLLTVAPMGPLSRSRSLPTPTTPSASSGSARTSPIPLSNPQLLSSSSSSSSLSTVTLSSSASSMLSPSSPSRPVWQMRQQNSFSFWNAAVAAGVEGRRAPRPLAPIKSLELMGEDHVLVPVLLDAVNAFRNSIEAIKGTTFVPHTPFETQPYHSDNSGQRLRWTWTLPRLQELELEGEVAVAFDLSTLQHCPKLRSLRLVLPTYLFSTCEDEDTLARMSEEVEHICKASQLVELELYGKWPLSDYLLLMIAERMRKLRKLLIVGARDVSPRGFQEAVAKIPTLEVLVIGQNLIPRANRQVRFQEMKTHNPRLTITVEED